MVESPIPASPLTDILHTAAAECGVKATKKACKDCTCGRAEGQMEKVELTPELLENPQSGCGSVSVLCPGHKLNSHSTMAH